MKSRFRVDIFKTIITAVALSAAMSSPRAHDAPISLISDVWLPFTGPAGVSHEGYMIEAAREIMGDHGISINYVNAVWARAMNEVKHGHIDCIVGVIQSRNPNYIFPKNEFGIAQGHFYGKKNLNWHYDGPASLEGLILGTIPDYDYPQGDLAAYISHPDNKDKIFKIHGLSPSRQMVNLVKRGRIDVFINQPEVYNWTVRDNPNSQIVSKGPLGPAEPLHIACSAEKPIQARRITTLLSAGIMRLRKDGRLQAIMKRYGLNVWAPLSRSAD